MCVSTNNMTLQSSECMPQIHHCFPVIRTIDNLMSAKMCLKSLQISISTCKTVTKMTISHKVHSLKLMVPFPGWSVLEAEPFLPITMLPHIAVESNQPGSLLSSRSWQAVCLRIKWLECPLSRYVQLYTYIASSLYRVVRGLKQPSPHCTKWLQCMCASCQSAYTMCHCPRITSPSSDNQTEYNMTLHIRGPSFKIFNFQENMYTDKI
jgi:hypothetical protein